MPKEYTKEQLWKLYEKLPSELKEAVFSEETAENIWDVCEKNAVEEVSQVARYAGHVLMGVLAPDDFQEALKKEVKLKKEVAKKVAQEINRFIFYPVKPALEELHKVEITPPTRPITEPTIGPMEKVTAEEETEEKPEAPAKKDTYREPIE